VKRGPALLQLDEQQQQTINKRRIISSINGVGRTDPSSSVRRPLTTVTSLRGYVRTVPLNLCGREMSSDFKNDQKSPQIVFENEKKALIGLEFCSRAGRMSSEGGLKVDDSC